MKIEVKHEGDVTVLSAVGALVIGRGEQLMNETTTRLLDQGRVHLVIDLGGVTKVDSSGVDSLIMTWRQARERGGDAKLARVTPRLQKLLELTHLNKVLEIYPDVARGVSSFTGS